MVNEGSNQIIHSEKASSVQIVNGEMVQPPYPHLLAVRKTS
jgi:hypothetical protein